MSSLLGIGGGGNVGVAGGGDFYSYSIDQSLRLDGSTAYLSKSDFAASTDTTKRTFSTWVKRGNPEGVGAYNHIIGAGSSAIDGFGFANGTAKLQWLQGGVVTKDGVRDLRDTSAWYHFFTTWNATDNEVYIYVNGELDYSSTNSIDALSKLGNTGHTTYIGKRSNSGVYIHGYLAETVFLDGTIGDVNDFGELVNGIWVPKNISAASLTYGTNGFYLDYADSSDLGKDVSGQGNHFTSNNLAAHDGVPDSPANNWCTLNFNDSRTSLGWQEGGLRWFSASYSYKAFSTMVIPEISDSDTYYAEYHMAADGYSGGIAPLSNSGSNSNTDLTGFLAYAYNGNFYNNLTATASGYDPVVGDIISIKAGNGQIEFFLNGTSVGTPYTGLTGSYKFGAWALGATGNGMYWNFGQDSTFAGSKTGSSNTADQNGFGDFYYAEAANNISLCAANIAEPAIGPNSATQADDYFNTVIYTGDGTTSRAITGVGFQPDFTWIKNRSVARNHKIYDTVRGAYQALESDTSDAEATNTNGLASFDADGFTINDQNNINGNTEAIVAWNWKAGGSSNTFNIDGTGYATASDAGLSGGNIAADAASINKTSGISILKYTGDGSGSPYSTIKHGLDSAPEVYICKSLDTDNADNWVFFHTLVNGSHDFIYLNLTNSNSDSAINFPPTLTTVKVGGDATNQLNKNFLMIAMHSVENFSKFGKYVGNGSTDGPFVYTGFRPAWVMVKRTDSTGNWQIWDATRNEYNVTNLYLRPNTSDAEVVGSGGSIGIDIISNGFKFRSNATTWNGSGGTYIYLAFAEAPFKYANAR